MKKIKGAVYYEDPRDLTKGRSTYEVISIPNDPIDAATSIIEQFGEDFACKIFTDGYLIGQEEILNDLDA